VKLNAEEPGVTLSQVIPSSLAKIPLGVLAEIIKPDCSSFGTYTIIHFITMTMAFIHL
jgi:hypothetical protein